MRNMSVKLSIQTQSLPKGREILKNYFGLSPKNPRIRQEFSPPCKDDESCICKIVIRNHDLMKEPQTQVCGCGCRGMGINYIFYSPPAPLFQERGE